MAGRHEGTKFPFGGSNFRHPSLGRACPAHMIHYLATNSVCSPPPCGEGLGVGVPRCGNDGAPIAPPPSPTLPHKAPQGGREQTSRIAPLCPQLTGTCSRPLDIALGPTRGLAAGS